ncbi:MAG: hypothetical protein ACREP7_09305 [Lysobacter sp.]
MSSQNPPDIADESAARLRRLGLWFCALAGLEIVAALLFGYAASGIQAGSSAAAIASEPGQTTMFVLLVCMALLIANATLALLHLLTVYLLRKRRARGLCMAISIVSCLFVPFGTILGVLALARLTEPRVKPLFVRAA